MPPLPPEHRQHHIHRRGAVADLIRRDVQQAASGLTDNDTTIIWKAMMLAPTLEVCEALLKGQKVPKSALDPLWARRFRL